MKKKIIFGLLIIIGLFTVTACGNSTKKASSSDLHKTEFGDMLYKEPKNYSKKEPVTMDSYKMIHYEYTEDENKAINLYCYDGKKLGDLVDDTQEYTTVRINGFEWRKYHNKDFGVEYDTYDYEYNGSLYRIELNVTDKYQDEFDEFMKEVSFKK